MTTERLTERELRNVLRVAREEWSESDLARRAVEELAASRSSTPEAPARYELMRRTAEEWLAMAEGRRESLWDDSARRALVMAGKSLLYMLRCPESEIGYRLDQKWTEPAPASPAEPKGTP